MKTIKRILAGACALSLTLAFAGCGSSSGSSSDGGTTTTTAAPGLELNEEDKETVASLADRVPDHDLGGNTTIKWLAHYDINPSNGQRKSPGLELFEQKFGGKIQWIQSTWNTRYDDLASQVMSKNSPDFFPASDMDTFPKGAIKGMFDPIDDVIALDSDLWAETKASSDKFVFNGHHYVAVIDVSPNFVCVYNTTTIHENGLDDPAELYWEGNWNWDTFKGMIDDFLSSTDSDDAAGLDGYWYVSAISESCGVPMIGLEDGMLVNNMSDPNIEKVQNFMYELGKQSRVMFDRSSNNWSTRGDGTTGNGLGDYQTLFIPVGLWGIENSVESTKPFGDMEGGEVMFVPMPKDPDSDKYYMSSRVEGFNLCKGAPNPEGFAAYMDCLMVAKKETKEITKNTLINDYKWNEDMYAMREETYRLAAENPVFNFAQGISAEMDSAYEGLSQGTMITGGDQKTWTEVRGEYEKQVDFLIKEANTKISDTPTE